MCRIKYCKKAEYYILDTFNLIANYESHGHLLDGCAPEFMYLNGEVTGD